VIDVAARLRAIRTELNGVFFERQQLIDAALYAVLAKQHLYAHGPVGAGKTDVINELVKRITGAPYFAMGLSRTRSDAAVLGPINLPRLRETGDYERKIDGYLLTAVFCFLDEIGKMSATLGHDLLAALNERVRHEVLDGVGSVHPIPLFTAFTASNELPAGESDDAAALWDRLLVRVVVDYIDSPVQFGRLLTAGDRPATYTTVPFDELRYVIEEVVPEIKIPDVVVEHVIHIRSKLREAGVIASDRRWRQSMRVLQARAFLNGTSEVEPIDLRALEFTLWDRPEQLEPIRRIRAEVADPAAKDALAVMDTIREIGSELSLRVAAGESLAKLAGFDAECDAKMDKIRREIAGLTTTHGPAAAEHVHDLTTAVDRLRHQLDTALGVPSSLEEGTA